MVRLAVVTLFLAFALAAGGLAGPEQALADRCQPEEFVLEDSPLGPDETDPRCPVMQSVVYDSVVCDDTNFMSCVGSIDALATAGYQREKCYDKLPFIIQNQVCGKLP